MTMGYLRRFFYRLRHALFPFDAESDLAREVDAHLRLMEDDYKRRGLTPEQARSAARKKFGGIEHAKEQHRDARSFVWLDDVRRDAAYTLRMARRNPGFALLSVAVLALAVGANTAVFSIVDTALLKPLPYPNPNRIVAL